MLLLRRRGAEISFVDPHVDEMRLDGDSLRASGPEAASAADCVVIVTDHSTFDYATILWDAALIVDTRNALKGVTSPKVFRL